MTSWKAMKKKWPSEFVARTKIGDFTGGAITPKTMAEHDSNGTGPKERQMLSSRVVYPIDSLIEWLDSKPKLTRKKENRP